MCADLVQRLGVKKSYQQNVSERELKWKKWKTIKRELYVAFISKNIILKESLTVRLWESAGDLQRKGK